MVINSIPSPAEENRLEVSRIHARLQNRVEECRYRHGDGGDCTCDTTRADSEVLALITAQNDATYAAVMEALPECQNHPSSSDPTMQEVAQRHYDQGWNDLHWKVRQNIAKIFGKEQI